VPVTFDEAALGAEVEIPTPDGRVSLKVPAGSQDGKLLRVKGRGAPKLKGTGRGDLLARLRVTVPGKLSKAQRQALEEFQKASRTNPRERLFG
jgi:molecular chaperone DnaJ